MAKDVHSFARPAEAVVTHLNLDIEVNFDHKQIAGKASLQIENKTGTRKLYLDSRGLQIERVTLGTDEQETPFTLGTAVKYLGQPLVIDIRANTQLVNVYYSTGPDADALQWLAPAQTAGGKMPFLFTQSEAILARTWIPCQDSPGIRMSYDARVKVPVGMMAVMSAENSTTRSTDGVYEFHMPERIPSYLLALAVGDIDFRGISERCGVYAEPSVVEKAAWELADNEKMVAAAEKLYGPYRWGRYDVIILPPSFPFGGMENPRLTFATPTILAGDRSLVSLVAHELAHSWSGNLVTNATWDDFWLNEGFTTYFENRIMEAVYGKEYEDMLAVLAMQDLKATIDEIGAESPDTDLHLNLQDRDPDAGMTDIAYEKGHFFLRMLEENFTREKWDNFLRGYFDRFAFQSMTSAHFLAYLREQLVKGDKALEQKLQLDAWVYGPGLPSNCPVVHSAALDKVAGQVQQWQSGTAAKNLQTKDWTTQHWLYFLNTLPDTIAIPRMLDLDHTFHLTDSGNSEILSAWLMHTISSKYTPAYPALEHFLTSQGRRKFLKPLYTKLAESAEGRALAMRIYKKARPMYHAVSSGTIDKILDWSEPIPNNGK